MSVFTEEDLNQFLYKHVDHDQIQQISHFFWKLPNLIQLFDPGSKAPLQKFSSKEVVEEEKKILRLSDRIHHQKSHDLSHGKKDLFSKGLNEEQ